MYGKCSTIKQTGTDLTTLKTISAERKSSRRLLNWPTNLLHRNYTLNATELARDKFNALFAAYDARDKRATAQEEKLALKTSRKATTKNLKP
jgi:hypothetical protein